MNSQPTPDMVPGYAEAMDSKLLPIVPSEPPKPVTMNSTNVLLICIATVFLSGFAGINIANMAFSPTWLDISIMSIPLLAAFASFYIPSKVRDKEYSAGYTYIDDAVMTYGGPLSKLLKAQNYAGPAGYQWNFRGLWKLNNNRSINRPPIKGFLPIGYYPSPTRLGEFEYWTGAEWMGKYKIIEQIPQGGRLNP